ncbi:MAG: AsmA family protein, partial [Gammaproteobacteria bacterium]|nr:AsmA family protein [Gammaproteobacteria bacterium]
RLIPDWPLPIEKLTKFNADVDIDITRYRQNQRIVDNLVLDATVRDGRLDIEHIGGKTKYGDFSAMLHVVPSEDSAMVQATYEGKNIFLGSTGDRTLEEIDADPKFDISVALNGAGLTSREIIDNLNGRIKMSASKGQIANTALNFIYGNFFEEIIAVINPFAKKEPYTKISCAVLVASIENGLLTAKPGMAIQTGKLNIISEGTIDLHTEKLSIHFKTAPRKKISISAGEFLNPYLKVVGTLASPRLTLDTTNTLVTGGAAVATVGLTLLATAVWDRVSSSDDPCSEVTKRTKN